MLPFYYVKYWVENAAIKQYMQVTAFLTCTGLILLFSLVLTTLELTRKNAENF